MKTINLRPSFRYRFHDSLRGMGIFFGIMVIITALVTGSYIWTCRHFGGETSSVTFSAYGFAATVALFVSGIACIREDLRVGIQHGISRRTSFVATLLSTVLISLILSVAGELLMAGAQAISANYNNLRIADMYQMMYTDWQQGGLNFVQHLDSVVINFATFLLANMIGMLISLVFYRLNRAWTIIVAVGVPVFVFIVLPILMSIYVPDALLRLMASTMEWIMSSPWYLVLFLAVCAVVAAAINWLLIRRAPIKAAKK